MSASLFADNPNITWEIWLRYPDGRRWRLLDFALSWEVFLAVNDFGSFSLVLPLRRLRRLQLLRVPLDSLIEFRRAAWGGALAPVFVGFSRYFDYSQDELEIKGYGLNYLLDGRIIDTYAESAYASKTDAGANIMRQYVREQMGASVEDSTRDLSSYGFTVEEDDNQGDEQSRSFSNKNLFKVLRTIASTSETTSTPLYFGITMGEGATTFNFRIKAGQPGEDRTTGGGVPFSVEAGTLADPHYIIDHRHATTRVKVGGRNAGINRVTAYAEDTDAQALSIWNLRETFADRRNATDSELADEGSSVLREERASKRFVADILDTKGSRFGRDWNFGDKIKAKFMGLSFEGLIRATSIKVSNTGDESVSARLEAEET